MGLWKWLTGGDVCHHTWKLIDANVSPSQYGGYAAVATLQCTECKRREYFEKGIKWNAEHFPSLHAGRVWIQSLLPADHTELKWTKSTPDD